MQLQQLLQLSTGYYTLGVGGAIYADNTVLTLQDSVFKSNDAVMDGGRCGTRQWLYLATAHGLLKAHWRVTRQPRLGCNSARERAAGPLPARELHCHSVCWQLLEV